MYNTQTHAEAVMSAVSGISGIPCETIRSKCSEAEVVDARWTAVFMLHKAGMYSARIAEHLNITPRYVQYIITGFDDRIVLNRPMRQIYEKATRLLDNQSLI